MDYQIQELQEKAFNGDEQALEMYNEYVNKGQAPRIATTNQGQYITGGLFGTREDGFKRSSMYGDVDPSKIHQHVRNPLTLMSAGYQKKEVEHLNKGMKNEATKQGDVTNFIGEKQERTLSPLEKMSLGYGDNGLQMNKETSVNPNDIKE